MNKLDYEGLFKKALQKNIEQLQIDLRNNEKNIGIKIENWSKKFGLNPSVVRKKIVDDNVFSLHYIKDPSKQNFYEKLAAKHIEGFLNVKNFKNLSGSGTNALVIHNGLLLLRNNVTAETVKTIDFEWDYKGTKCYATHKYTKNFGGAQDNQYKDVRDFMKNARGNNQEKVLFFAICDGDYYQKKVRRSSKIEALNSELGRDNKLVALTIDELFGFLTGMQFLNL